MNSPPCKGQPLRHPMGQQRVVAEESSKEPFPRRLTNYDCFAPLPTGESSPIPPLGVERRIVRRAETLWRKLCGNEALPPASAARALLAPPFTSRAILYVGRYPVYAGADLACIGVTLSPAAPDSFAARLSGLAASAVRKGRPMLFDTRTPENPDTGVIAGPVADTVAGAVAGPPDGLVAARLLARAVALPFSPSRNHLSSVVVVASWRQLLPENVTSALHQEMAKVSG